MNTFIYAIPGGNPVTEQILKAAGLADIFDGQVTQRDYKGTFFEGEPVVLFVPEDCPADKARCHPEKQTWQKSADGKYWVGIDNETVPGEVDLSRKKQFEGHLVKLGNGEKWLIPIARRFGRGSALPKALILGSKGELMTEELPEYAEFSAQVERFWEYFIAAVNKESSREMTPQEQWQLLVRAMQLNYRITAEGISLLKLVTTENFNEILEAIIDIPTVMKIAAEENKKKEDLETHGTFVFEIGKQAG
jgi:hypothetical protein